MLNLAQTSASPQAHVMTRATTKHPVVIRRDGHDIKRRFVALHETEREREKKKKTSVGPVCSERQGIHQMEWTAKEQLRKKKKGEAEVKWKGWRRVKSSVHSNMEALQLVLLRS